MEAMTTTVSASDFKDLLTAVMHRELGVLIRYRTLGQLWYPNFLRIVKLEDDKKVLFHDLARKRLIGLSDVSRIIQFELDRKFGSYEPHCLYQVSEDYSD